VPFLFKLARRLGLGRSSVIVAASATLACGVDAPTAVEVLGTPDAKVRIASTDPASISISPSSAGGSLGQTAQFTATVYDGAGRVVSNAIIGWSSSDSTIVSVTSSGFAAAVGVGSAQLVARVGTITKSAPVSVSGVPIATITVTPGNAAGDVGDSAPFTAMLKDANGNVLTGRRVLWTTSAPAVVTIDSTGFARAVGPGTATITAYSAGKSAAATATVNGAAVPPPPPAPTVVRVAVSPSSASGNVGDAAQFSATAYDANNNVMSGTVTWSSSNSAVLSVNATGYAIATGPGSATLVATVAGVQGTSAITVLGSATPPPPPPDTTTTTTTTSSSGWGNAPSSWSTLSDQPFSLLNSLNWFLGWGSPTIALDATAPQSASTVLEFTYPAGMAGGTSPANVARGLGSARRVYSGFWFKTNAGWQGHNTGVNKLAFVYMNGGGGDATIMFYGPPGGPYQLRTALQFRNGDTRFWLPPNVANPPVTMGAWHKVEWLVDYGTSGQPNGTIKFWMDGQLLGNYTDVLFPVETLTEFQFSPTWGGIGDMKQNTDRLWIDHVLLKG
jgi:uncharacterized protein YjdB